MSKNDERQKIKEILRHLDPAEKIKKDEIIFEKIIGSPQFKETRSLFTYVSRRDEVNTTHIIEHTLNRDKAVFIPRVDTDQKKIFVHQIFSLQELQKGAFSIMEPVGEESDKKEFDLILVPGLAFDSNGNRLGRGGGYFDRFLKEIRGFTIGICYQEQLVKKIPLDEHDIRMDHIITDR
ncbi:MAG: 5-formyltetrahydrofolate cyclo-ligase [Spirochaetes bacterium]|nr:5-formyltetrahydrofolate cyclo-ligase [Spirochaetota bacterium]